MTKGIVNIHGKEYKTVALRVNEFREKFKPDDGWCIRTWLASDVDDRVVVQASICDKDDHVVATGIAEEVRGQGKINQTSAVENCETSAIGRALAAFGLGGEEYCSADELLNALDQQDGLKKKDDKPLEYDQDDPWGEDGKEAGFQGGAASNVVNLEEAKKEAKPRRHPKDMILEKLGIICESNEELEVRAWFTMFLKHCEHADGKLSLDQITNVPRLWLLYNEFKAQSNKAWGTEFNVRKPKEESNEE